MMLEISLAEIFIGVGVSVVFGFVFKTYSTTQELFVMHNVKDPDGVPVWYVRQSLSSAIERLASATEQQTELLKHLVHSYDRMNETLTKRESGE